MKHFEKKIDDQGNLLRFTGFPEAGLRFLKNLKRNNRRDWFQPRQAQYEELLVRPMRALVIELGDRLADELPGMRFDPKRAIFRIYRDTRFSEDKAPYKTHIAAHMAYPNDGPGFYLHVEPGWVFTGGGLYMPSSEQLKRIRLRINDDPETFRRLIEAPAIKRLFGGMGGEPLKRAPKGWPSDHPHLDLLKMKQYIAGKEMTEAACRKKDFPAVVARHLAALIPLVKWLHENIK